MNLKMDIRMIVSLMLPHIVSLFYRLDTAVMLANLFIAHLKIKDKGVFYKERVKALHQEIYKNL